MMNACVLLPLLMQELVHSYITLQLHTYTVFTWLNAAPRIVAALDWYHN